MRRSKFWWVLGVALLGVSAPAQTPSQLLDSAFKNREASRAALLQLEAARRTAGFQSAYPLTRLEVGDGTRPDVQGGEDLTLFQPIDVFGKNGALRASARASVRAAEATYRQTLLDIQGQVLTAYVAWANAVRTLRTAQDQLDVANAIAHATSVRVAARSLPEIENIRSQLEVQRGEQAVVDAQAAVEAVRVKLTQAAGQPVAGDPVGLDPVVLLAPTPEQNRPELLGINAQLASLNAERRQADLSLFPDVELQARRSPWSTAEQYGVRLQLVVPLWDHGAARDRSLAAKRGQAAASLQLTDTRNRIKAELAAADIQVQAAQKSLIAYQKLVAGARELVTKTQRGYMLGAATLVEVYDAKRVLNDTLGGQSTAQFNLDQAVQAALAARGQILRDGL